jgi:modulator of FtsH protease HflC
MIENKIFVTLAAIFFLSLMSLFTVNETEKAIKFQLGEIVKSDYQPGLHLKLPFVHKVKKFDGRIQTMNSAPESFLTAEKKNVVVDSYVKWRIGDVKTFYTTVAGNVDEANSRLSEIIKDAFRSEFAKRDIKQLVSTDRKAIRDILLKNVKQVSANLGLEIIDVRIKRIDLPPDVSSSVFSRMETERARVARQFRSQGAEAAERIRADADRQQVVTIANAFREAEKLRGEGDAKAAEIYANAYTADAEFFAFYRSLNAYKNVFNKPNNMIVVEPTSDFFKYFKNQKTGQ